MAAANPRHRIIAERRIKPSALHIRFAKTDHHKPDAALLAQFGPAPVLVLPMAGSVAAEGKTAGAGECLVASLSDCRFSSGALSLVAQPV